MTPGQRVILNTAATYLRTIFSVILGLFSGRWILQALGEVDYGLLGVVGGLIGFVTVLNGIVSGTCSRFFALSIGKGDIKETKTWFSTALVIHIILPTLLIIVGWPIGEWAIFNYCNIPENRLITAQWVFRLSLVSAFISMMSAPYMGMFIAKQRIAEVSLWNICNTVTNFIFVYWLLRYKGDTWLMYAIGQVTMNVFFIVVQSYRASRLYKECRFEKKMCFNYTNYKKIFYFASWQLFGGLTGIFRGNLIAILINKRFPPTIFPGANASMQVGGTISSYTQTISTALNSALSPEITSTEGRGDRSRVLLLANKASKISSFLVLCVGIPISIEIKEILILWLGNPPEMAWYFALMYLICLFLDNMTTGYMIAINAVGRIAWYQITVGMILLSAFPLAWILVVIFEKSYISVGWALAITTGLASIGRAIWAKYLIGTSIISWLKTVVTPCFVVLTSSLIIGLITKTYLPYNGFLSLLTTVSITFLSVISIGYLIIFDKDDRSFVLKQLNIIKSKLYKK